VSTNTSAARASVRFSGALGLESMGEFVSKVL
jgi:hypothetical protein